MAPAPRRRGQCAGARRESRRAGAAAGVVPWAAESAAARGVPGTGRDERGRGRPLGVAAGAQLRVRLQCPSDPPAVLVVLCKWLPGLPEASLGRGLPWAAPGPASDGQRQRVADGSQRPEVAEFCPQLRLGAAVPGWGSGRTCALAACPLARGFPVSVSPRGSQALRRVWVGWGGARCRLGSGNTRSPALPRVELSALLHPQNGAARVWLQRVARARRGLGWRDAGHPGLPQPGASSGCPQCR